MCYLSLWSVLYSVWPRNTISFYYRCENIAAHWWFCLHASSWCLELRQELSVLLSCHSYDEPTTVEIQSDSSTATIKQASQYRHPVAIKSASEWHNIIKVISDDMYIFYTCLRTGCLKWAHGLTFKWETVRKECSISNLHARVSAPGAFNS